MKKRNTFEQSQGESLGHSCNCGRLVNIEAVCPLLKFLIKGRALMALCLMVLCLHIQPGEPVSFWYFINST